MATTWTTRRAPPVMRMPGADAVAGRDELQEPAAGTGKCTVGGCGCVSYVEPPGGFECKRCGHKFSDHW